MISIGTRVFSLGAIALGLTGLVWDDFALQWQPVPEGLPGRGLLAYAFAAALIVGGVAVNLQRTAALGAALLCILYSIVVVLMHGADLLSHAGIFAAWSGAAEQLVLAVAALIAYAQAAGRPSFIRGAQITFAVCLVLFGIAHFAYLKFTAAMVPGWLPPGQEMWAITTGIAHIAAGLAILVGIQAQLAAYLLTIMFALFGALIHAPLLSSDPHNHLYWVMNAMNLALTGSAWVVADSLPHS